eukprot:maker-scaffold67_size430214-snap-gene-1.22 protein:Tk00778 transcript:maker-scaffold67_size430214-snap-gene-1.22-mRNA-1 annotation:"retinol dehydrogenase 12-like"
MIIRRLKARLLKMVVHMSTIGVTITRCSIFLALVPRGSLESRHLRIPLSSRVASGHESNGTQSQAHHIGNLLHSIEPGQPGGSFLLLHCIGSIAVDAHVVDRNPAHQFMELSETIIAVYSITYGFEDGSEYLKSSFSLGPLGFNKYKTPIKFSDIAQDEIALLAVSSWNPVLGRPFVFKIDQPCNMLWTILEYMATFYAWLFGLALLAWVIKEATMGICRSDKRLEGKVVLITGGNSGIGLETAKDLAFRGAEIVIACRNLSKTRIVVDALKEETGNPKICAKPLDLSSQKDTNRFARDILAEYPQIHYLINNAGMAGDVSGMNFYMDSNAKTTSEMTKEGFEVTMATNFLGPLTLTEMLKERVKESGSAAQKSRIIHVSSIGNSSGQVDLKNLDLNLTKQQTFDAGLQYCNTKLFQLLYNRVLAHELQGSQCESVALHPGVVRTNIFQNVNSMVLAICINPFLWLYGKSSKQGAQTSIFCVVSEDKMNGRYLEDCRDGWFRHATVKHESIDTLQTMIGEIKNMLKI